MSNPATALGIDIGGTNLRVARVSGIGEILDWLSNPSRETLPSCSAGSWRSVGN